MRLNHKYGLLTHRLYRKLNRDADQRSVSQKRSLFITDKVYLLSHVRESGAPAKQSGPWRLWLVTDDFSAINERGLDACEA
jgi:hypothetical protein